MTPSSAGTKIVHLVDRLPALTGAQMLQSLVPPPQFDGATFESYRSDDSYPSQEESKALLMRFAQGGVPATRGGGLFRRAKREEPMKPGVYLDGGFGVGKTHLLASIYHAVPARRKYFGSFIEYTALVGALGYQNTVELLQGADLLCIDEFELDDPGDTMVMTRLLGSLVSTGTRLAATSNTPPNALGEGRFAASDFLREIHQMADSFQTIRIDGVDFRQRSLDGTARTYTDNEYQDVISAAASEKTVSDDSFADLLRHLAVVHPSRYIRLIDGLGLIGIQGVYELRDQSEALRFVAFIDRAYDAQLPIISSGTSLEQVFSAEMLAGGYRKKYLRAMSRLVALTNSN